MANSGILVNPFTVEYIAPGVINERSVDGLLTIFTVDNGNPKTIDAWLDYAQSTLVNWPSQQPCYMLHDIRKTKLRTFNTQLGLRLRSLFTLHQESAFSVAIVIPDEFADEADPLTDGPSELGLPYELQLFLTRNEAIAWLLRDRN